MKRVWSKYFITNNRFVSCYITCYYKYFSSVTDRESFYLGFGSFSDTYVFIVDNLTDVFI